MTLPQLKRIYDKNGNVLGEVGTGNIYADLGYPNAEEMLLKANIVHEIAALMKARGMTQAELGRLVKLPQPKISNLLRGQFREFSIERLLSIVNRLGRSVEIVIANHDVPAEQAVTVLRRQARKGTSARGKKVTAKAKRTVLAAR